MFRLPRALVGGAVLLSATLHAQTFNAASIKRSEPGNPSGSTFEYQTGGALRVRNGTLRGLIESAYDVRDFQIVGGPGWLNADRFDVLARSESAESPVPRTDEMKTTRLKLQALLADRFKLVVRHETRDATGLTERYNFQLSWTPDLVPCADSAENAPSLFTALQEQLGLKLESTRGPVDVVVVDRAERPTED